MLKSSDLIENETNLGIDSGRGAVPLVYFSGLVVLVVLNARFAPL